MPERKVQIPFPSPTSPLRTGTEVAARESTERWTEVLLEDGTTLRVKPTVLSAVRIDDAYDADGNPMYALKVSPTAVVSAPENLKRTPGRTPVQ